MTVLAAISLNCFAAGFLFIPVRDYQRRHTVKKQTAVEDGKDEDTRVHDNEGHAIEMLSSTEISGIETEDVSPKRCLLSYQY